MTSRPSLLAAVDFSSASIDALKWSVKWLKADRDLVLAHVLAVPGLNNVVSAKPAVPDSLLFNAHVGARRRLDDLRKALGYPEARIEVGEGKPGNAIAEIARSTRSDLIVVGKHGEGGPLRGHTGRTADSLIRSAPVPIVVANGTLGGPPKKIIVALTHSSITPYIVEWTRRVQHASGAEIIIVHVIGSATLSHVLSMSVIKTGEQPRSEEIDEIFSEDRDRWTDMLVDAGVPNACIKSTVIFGEVSASILGVQITEGADLIVMGSHAGPVRRFLLGSAATSVIRNAEIPVMVVVEPQDSIHEEKTASGATIGAGEKNEMQNA